MTYDKQKARAEAKANGFKAFEWADEHFRNMFEQNTYP